MEIKTFCSLSFFVYIYDGAYKLNIESKSNYLQRYIQIKIGKFKSLPVALNTCHMACNLEKKKNWTAWGRYLHKTGSMIQAEEPTRKQMRLLVTNP